MSGLHLLGQHLIILQSINLVSTIEFKCLLYHMLIIIANRTFNIVLEQDTTMTCL